MKYWPALIEQVQTIHPKQFYTYIVNIYNWFCIFIVFQTSAVKSAVAKTNFKEKSHYITGL